MKRLLAFVALFALGLALLLWIERRGEPSESPQPPAQPTSAPTAPAQPGPAQGEQLTEMRDAQGNIVQGTLSGPLDTRYKPLETGKLRYQVTSSNVALVANGEFELTNVHALFYDDRGDGSLESEATATRARAKLNTLNIDQPIDENFPITLFDADATLHKGSRFAPVKLRVPQLEGTFATRHFTSKDAVNVAGRGLIAEGRGLELDGLQESLKLLEDPRATVEFETGAVARVASHGTFTAKSRPDLGPNTVEIEARDQATFKLEGGRKFDMRADVVRLFGDIESGADQRFTPLRAEAEGHVVLEPSDGVFSGERAEIEFLRGQPANAALDGDPRVDLVLRGERLERVPSELLVEGETLTVNLRGAGPLELFFGDDERFEFTGPVKLELPALAATLDATTSISGTRGADARFHELAALGDAHFDYDNAHAAAEDLLVRAFIDENGRAAARLVGVGSTHITGTLEDGRTVDLLARKGLTGERRREGLRVTNAEDVDLTIGGVSGATVPALHAKADRVFDADLAAVTLIAEGNVAFETERGRGRGSRLDVRNLTRGELSGDDVRPARFDLEPGSFEARYIDFDGVRVQARIDAHATATMADAQYDIEARWVAVERHPLLPAGAAEYEDGITAPGIVLLAGGEVHAVITSASEAWHLSSDELRAFADERPRDKDASQIEATGLVARGSVAFDYAGAARVSGSGDKLELTPDRHGRLYPLPDEKVTLRGALPGTEIGFDLAADWVEFSPTQLAASGFDITVLGLDVPWQEPDAPAGERSIRAIGATLAADENSILLTDAYLGGKTATRGDWSFDAPFVMLGGSATAAQAGAALGAVRDLIAWGGFSAQLGELGFARGDSIQLINDRRTVTLSGSPATILRPELRWSSPWFDMDLETGFVRSEGGEISAATDVGQPWTLRYSSLEPVVTPDETIQVMRDPVLTQGGNEVRAGWAVAWLDRGELSAAAGAAPTSAATEAPQTKGKQPLSLFGQTAVGELSRWLREVYLEGEIEFRVEGERRARASSAYFDLVDGNGWLRDVNLRVHVHLSSRADSLEVKAGSLRHSADGSLHAYDAVVTTCTFDQPHYVVRIGDFSMVPRWKEETLPPEHPGEKPKVTRKHEGWSFALEHNKIASPGGVELPMPPIRFPTNPDFDVDPNALEVAGINIPSFGQDSKFGTFISASFTSDLGWLGRAFHSLVDQVAEGVFGSTKLPDVEGRTKYTGSYYGSRGVRGGIESKFESKGKYVFETLFDLIYDTGDDHGLVRVPKDDREEWRAWFRTRGRYMLDDHEWLDLVLTYQTDPGVQAEFFESDYLHFEERETYVHYRKAKDERQWHVTLEAELDSFRTEVLDQPALGYFRGRSQIAEIAKLPLIYTSNTTLDHLKRVESDEINSMTGLPYEPPFADGLGERDVSRFDTTQRLETPVDLEVAGLRATPFVAGRVTGWSDNAAEDDVASRAALLAGAEIATTFWKLFPSGSRHSWTPSVAYHADVASTDNGLPVAQFDPVDAPIDGEFVDLAVRSRWEYRELKSDLDIELRETWADDLPASPVVSDGWQPLITRASWLSRVFGMPFGVSHDARYDTASAQTNYSSTTFGWEPRPDLDLETGYHFARDLAGARIYDAISLGARYTLSSKWEIDGDYTFSISDNGDRLGSSMTLRRIGHDFVFEIASSFVAGEGGGSVHFNITPLITWHPDDDRLIDQWRAGRP